MDCPSRVREWPMCLSLRAASHIAHQSRHLFSPLHGRKHCKLIKVLLLTEPQNPSVCPEAPGSHSQEIRWHLR